jgi:hypothetical protein
MDTQTAATDALSGVLTTTDMPSAIVPAQAATPPSIHSITSLITIRLTRENFLLWKTQAVPALHAAHLFGYVDGSIVADGA